MRIGILSAELEPEDARENERLLEEITLAGHEGVVINYRLAAVGITAEGRRAYVFDERGRPQPLLLDAVIPRVNEADPASISHAILVLETMLSNGAYSPITPAAIDLTKYKIRGQLLLDEAGIPTPPSAAPAGIDAQLQHAGALVELITADTSQPTIIKTCVGTHGLGVVRGDSVASARSIIEGFACNRIPVMVQEFIQTSPTAGNCADLRLVVVNNRVVAAMRRECSSDFRANLSLNGHGQPYTPTAQEISLALRAAQILGARTAGVDLVVCQRRGPMVLEVNSSPGFGIERITGVNVAGAIVAMTLRGIKVRHKARAMLHRPKRAGRLPRTPLVPSLAR